MSTAITPQVYSAITKEELWNNRSLIRFVNLAQAGRYAKATRGLRLDSRKTSPSAKAADRLSLVLLDEVQHLDAEVLEGLIVFAELALHAPETATSLLAG